MKMNGNTILVTGGGTGIGRALAERLHARGNQVILAGRRAHKLAEVVAAHPGMSSFPVDLADAKEVRTFAAQLLAEHPSLNVVIHNAGIMRAEPLFGADALDIAEATIATNLLGLLRLNQALLPHLLEQPRAAIWTVSSGLAFVPKVAFPTYCATKAALHSYTQSLRHRLRGTSVQVVELIPPLVQTELTGPEQATNPLALPLDDYIDQSLAILSERPDVTEVVIERVEPQRYAERRGQYEALFERMNEAPAAGPPVVSPASRSGG